MIRSLNASQIARAKKSAERYCDGRPDVDYMDALAELVAQKLKDAQERLIYRAMDKGWEPVSTTWEGLVEDYAHDFGEA